MNILLSLLANILTSPVVICQTVSRSAEVLGAACDAVAAPCSARFVAIPGGSTVEGVFVPVVLTVRAETGSAGPGSGTAPAPAAVRIDGLGSCTDDVAVAVSVGEGSIVDVPGGM
jgi:hypothetical protein